MSVLSQSESLKEIFYQLVRANHAVFDFMQEAGPNGLSFFEADNPLERWYSPAIIRFLGYEPADAHILGLKDLVVREDWSLAGSYPPQKKAGSQKTIRFLHRNQSRIAVHCSMMRVTFRDKIYIAEGYTTDHLQERTSEKRFRMLLENGQDAVAILSEKGLPLYVTPSVRNILGYREHEILKINIFSIIHPDDQPEAEKMLIRAISRPGEIIEEYNLRHLHKNGSWRWIASSLTNLLHDPIINGIVNNFRDVTERIESEKLLQLTNKQLRSAQRIARVGYWEHDFTGGENFWSDEMFEILGLQNTGSPPTFEEFLTFVHPADTDNLLTLQRAALNDDHIQSMEYRVLRNDGSIVHVETIMNRVIKNDSIIIEGTLQDITSRKIIERALANERNLLRTLMDNLPELIYAKDLEGRFTVANIASAKALGVNSPEKILGKTDFDFLPKALAEEYRINEQHILSEGQPMIDREEPFRDPETGTPGWILTTKVPLKNDRNEIIGIIGIGHDITSRKNAEQAIRQSEGQLSVATQIAKLGYWEFDILAGEFKFTDQLYAVLRTNASEVGGYTMKPDEYAKRFLHPDDVSIIQNEIIASIKTADPRYSRQIEHRFLLPNGEIGYMAVRFFVVKDESGNPIKTIGANQDITEIKRAQESLQQLLNTTTDQNKRLKDFSYIISHNLRSSVANLLGLAKVLAEDPGNMECIRMLEATTNKLDTTLKNINELLHFETEFNPKLSDDCRLLEVIQRVIELNNQLIRAKQVDIQIDIPEELTLKAIPAYLDSIFHNLITNALKYGITETSKRIEIHARKQKDKAVVEIRDYGLGINLEKDGEKLFKLGSRLHSTSDGQGLGLFMTKHQVEVLGGTISLESVVARGTTFRIELNT